MDLAFPFTEERLVETFGLLVKVAAPLGLDKDEVDISNLMVIPSQDNIVTKY